MIRPPAPNPCGSCPYRKDTPSGVWETSEYEKLPEYDNETSAQPPKVFLCHQQDGRACAGWVGCHDMENSLGLRMAGSLGKIDPDDLDAFFDYETSTPLWGSGAEAAEHGVKSVAAPDTDAQRVIDKLTAKRDRREREVKRMRRSELEVEARRLNIEHIERYNVNELRLVVEGRRKRPVAGEEDR